MLLSFIILSGDFRTSNGASNSVNKFSNLPVDPQFSNMWKCGKFLFSAQAQRKADKDKPQMVFFNPLGGGPATFFF